MENSHFNLIVFAGYLVLMISLVFFQRQIVKKKIKELFENKLEESELKEAQEISDNIFIIIFFVFMSLYVLAIMTQTSLL